MTRGPVQGQARARRATPVGAVPIEIGAATAGDDEELFEAFGRIVAAEEGFPQQHPLTRAAFEDAWTRHASTVQVARLADRLVGAYYLKPNYPGRAAHIANAGYFVLAPHRGKGIGHALVEHSLREAVRLGFDAMVFNLVFASNLARGLYEGFGFEEVGRIPHAVEGEEAVMYWRSLQDVGL